MSPALLDSRAALVLDRPAVVVPAERRPMAKPVSAAHSELHTIAPGGNRSPAYLVIKRLLDIAGTAFLIVMLAPVLVLTGTVLWFTTRGKPLFRQERVGQCGRRFTLYKFRTMSVDAEQRRGHVMNQQSGPVFKNRTDPRITRVGLWLRKTSIDEMPQLWNVLRGDMSLVGPRPPLESEVRRYEPWQLGRLSVQPGLTCLWQVSGRSDIGFHDWVCMDLWYVEHQSLLLDLALLAKTPQSVLSCRGAY